MPGEKATKKAGPVKPGAAKKAQQTRVKRKEGRAVKASNSVTSKYIEALIEQESTNYCLALVTQVHGGGRFQAFDFVHKKVADVKVSNKLFTKKAKHRNAIIPVAVRADSYVIIDDANTIQAVVGETDAAYIRSLIHSENTGAKSNNLFNRGEVKPRRSSSRRSSRSKRSSSKSPKVNINDL